MNRRSYSGLIALNIALLVALAFVTFSSGATAQDEAARSRGEYTMVAGRIQGSAEDAIYIIDSSNQEMLALRWDNSRKRLDGLDYASFRRQGGGGRSR